MFTQHAKGMFTVEVGGRWHCGPDNTTPKQLAYEVTIEYPDGALDTHGFLIDNLAFQKYFDTIRYTEDSCEMVASKANTFFRGLCLHRDTKVKVDICVPGLADIESEEVEDEYMNGNMARAAKRLEGVEG